MKRHYQFMHIRDTIVKLTESKRRYHLMKFASLKALIITLDRVLEGASPERYTAMVRSYMNENTNDLDATWY